MNTKLTAALSAALSAALAAALLPALSLAAAPAETHIVGSSPSPTVLVHTGDLDLANPKGAQALHGRLNDAAWQVCEQMLDRPVSIEGGKCRAQLVEEARQKVAAR
jgi:UrcA family protein